MATSHLNLDVSKSTGRSKVSTHIDEPDFTKTSSQLIADMSGHADNIITSSVGDYLDFSSRDRDSMLALTMDESPVSPLLALGACPAIETQMNSLSYFDRAVGLHKEPKTTAATMDDVSFAKSANSPFDEDISHHLNHPSGVGFNGSHPINNSFSDRMLHILSDDTEMAQVCVSRHAVRCLHNIT